MTCTNTNNPKFLCRACAKNVYRKDKTDQCDLCEHWIHIKYNYLDYRYFQNCNESWYCIEFCSKIFPCNFLSCEIKTSWLVAPIPLAVLCSGKGPKSAENSSLL